MTSEGTGVSQEKAERVHDQGPSLIFSEFMKSGWAESDLTELEPLEVVTYAYSRRQVLSAAYPGIRLVLPAGELKVRAGDTDYNYRPDSAFAYYSGVQGPDATADAVLILEPSGDSHITYLYMNPRSTRDTEAFYRDARYGELWVGRRFTLSEAKACYQIETRNLSELKELLADGKKSLSPADKDFATFISEQRLCKDEYEVSELQRAVHATTLGFNDVISSIPAAVQTSRGERVLDAAFYGRARILGNDLGYNTIVGAGSHACVLHWTRNDGDLHPGELVLIDAGVEMESFYTADITRTFPINGRFSPAQRALYQLVYEAQLAGFAAVKPGALFSDVNKACQEVLARGLADMGVLTISVEESM